MIDWCWRRVQNRVEVVHWVAEEKRPFSIVADKRFRVLMKTGPGRSEQYVPLPATVGCDVQKVFAATQKCITTMLQVSNTCLRISWITYLVPKDYNRSISLATDAWTSPNNKPFVAFTVHFEQKGQPTLMVLDMLELSMKHTGFNLAEACANVVRDFGLENKVSVV